MYHFFAISWNSQALLTIYISVATSNKIGFISWQYGKAYCVYEGIFSSNQQLQYHMDYGYIFTMQHPVTAPVTITKAHYFKFLSHAAIFIVASTPSPAKLWQLEQFIWSTSECTCPIVQVRAYTCLPRLLHLLSLPSLLHLVFAWLVFCTYLVYFPMAIATYSFLCMSTF